MKKLMFFCVIVLGFFSCEELVPLPDRAVSLQTGDIDVDNLTVSGMIEGQGDGLLLWGHTWTTDGTIPVYEENGINQQVFTSISDSVFTSNLPNFLEETNYRVRAFALDVYYNETQKVYYGLESSATKVISFIKVHQGYGIGNHVIELEDGGYLIGTSKLGGSPVLLKTDKFGNIDPSFESLDPNFEGFTQIQGFANIDNGFLVCSAFSGGYKIDNIDLENKSVVNTAIRIDDDFPNTRFGSFRQLGPEGGFQEGDIYALGYLSNGSESRIFHDSYSQLDLANIREILDPPGLGFSPKIEFALATDGDLVMVAGMSGGEGILIVRSNDFNEIVDTLQIPNPIGGTYGGNKIKRLNDNENKFLVSGIYCLSDCIGIASWLVDLDNKNVTQEIKADFVPGIAAITSEILEDNSIVYAGSSSSPVGVPKILKVERDGTVLFERLIDVNNIVFSDFYDVAQTSDGGFILTGTSGGVLIQVKTSPTGFVH